MGVDIVGAEKDGLKFKQGRKTQLEFVSLGNHLFTGNICCQDWTSKGVSRRWGSRRKGAFSFAAEYV
jgi:hypothetical protein